MSHTTTLTIQNRIGSYEEAKKAEIARAASSSIPYRDLLLYLENEIEKSTKMADFNHSIRCFKNDGVYALNRAIEAVCGVSKFRNEEAPSGGVRNMTTVNIELADGTRIKAPYGTFSLPDMGEDAEITIHYHNNDHVLIVRGSCEFRFSSMIDDIVIMTVELLNTDSIYKDMAIEIGSDFQPKRLNLDKIEDQFMVLSEDAEYSLRPLRSRILEPQKCLDKGIELKTGVLLEG